MGNINLLPEELREKERKELEAVKKKPKVIKIEMTSPPPEFKPKPLKKPRPSLLSRLFAQKITPPKPISAPPPAKAAKPPELKITRPTKKFFHIPRFEKPKAEAKPELPPEKFAFEKREEPEIISTPPLSKPAAVEAEEKKLITPQEKVIEIKEKMPTLKKKMKFDLFSWLKFRISKGKKKEKIKEEVKKEKVKEKVPTLAEEKLKLAKERIEEIEEEKKAGLWVNLIPKELAKEQELALPKNLLISGLIIFLFILLIGVVYLGITWYQIGINNQIQQLENEIKDINEKIAGYETVKLAALDLQKRLKLIRGLLDKHIYWTAFFDKLEKYTIKEVYYTDFSMAGTEKLVLSAVGKDYQSVAKQLVVFQQADDFVAKVEIDSASAEVDKKGNYVQVNFNINLTFLPDIFLKPIK